MLGDIFPSESSWLLPQHSMPLLYPGAYVATLNIKLAQHGLSSPNIKERTPLLQEYTLEPLDFHSPPFYKFILLSC